MLGGKVMVGPSARPIQRRHQNKVVLAAKSQDSSECESLYARVFHLSPVAIAITTLHEGRFIEVNESLLDKLGYSGEEIAGRTSLELGMWFDPDDRRKVVERLFEQGSVQNSEVRLRTKASEPLVVLASLERIELDNQDCILAMFQDITERKRAEEGLRESQELYELVTRSTTDAVYDWHVLSGYTRWNHGLNTLFGYPANDGLAHLWWQEQVHPDDVQRVMLSFQAATERGGNFWSEEYRFRRSDGSYADVLERSHVMYEEGAAVRVIGAVVDISDRVRLAEARIKATLEERQRLARDLHDSVTQSLYSLTLFAEATRRLLRVGDVPQAKDYLRRVNETARQSLKEMRLLIYELRPAVLEKESLVGALQQRLDAVEKRAGVKACLSVNGVSVLPAPLEEALYCIAQEALNNAVKHAEATQVTVNLQSDSNTICLEVNDNGKGFDVESVRHQGGMGLSSLQERVASLSGTIFIQSQPNQGTTIRVTVPQP